METVAFVCEKGGVGKTTLSQELLYYLQRLEVPTSLYSLDGQYRSRSVKVDNPAVVILDTPGTLDNKLETIVSNADVVVIPVRPTPNDVEPFLRTLNLVEDNTDAPIIVCVNGMNAFTAAKAFMDWLEVRVSDDDAVYRVLCVPQSEAIVQSMGTGHSVVFHDKYGKATKALVRLCDSVADYLDVLG